MRARRARGDSQRVFRRRELFQQHERVRVGDLFRRDGSQSWNRIAKHRSHGGEVAALGRFVEQNRTRARIGLRRRARGREPDRHGLGPGHVVGRALDSVLLELERFVCEQPRARRLAAHGRAQRQRAQRRMRSSVAIRFDTGQEPRPISRRESPQAVEAWRIWPRVRARRFLQQCVECLCVQLGRETVFGEPGAYTARPRRVAFLHRQLGERPEDEWVGRVEAQRALEKEPRRCRFAESLEGPAHVPHDLPRQRRVPRRRERQSFQANGQRALVVLDAVERASEDTVVKHRRAMACGDLRELIDGFLSCFALARARSLLHLLERFVVEVVCERQTKRAQRAHVSRLELHPSRFGRIARLAHGSTLANPRWARERELAGSGRSRSSSSQPLHPRLDLHEDVDSARALDEFAVARSSRAPRTTA